MTTKDFEAYEARLKDEADTKLAAAILADHRWRDKPTPRRDRIWTGVFAGRRAYRGQQVILPDGSLGFIFGIQRGMAAVWRPAPFALTGKEHFVLRVDQLTPYRLPSAVSLGRQKAGCKELPSEHKRASCRANGCMPCRPGRRRGRPRRPAAPPAPA